MMYLMAGLTMLFLPLFVTAAEECPVYNLKPGDKDVRAYTSIKVPAHCDKKSLINCPGGKVAINSQGVIDGSMTVALRCFTQDDKDIEKYIAKRHDLGITMEIEEGLKTSLDKASKDTETLRKEALAKGIPAVVFDRAHANYLALLKEGKTSRGCFMAVDLTTPGNGKAWTVCAGAPPSIKEETTFWGSGMGEGCESHIYSNHYSQCAQFFGNKPKYCLSAGGRYLTGEVQRDTGLTREFVTLFGLEPGDNDNTKERKVGIHQTSTDDGRQSYVGQVPPFSYSQGCITLPFRGKSPMDPDMTEFSSRQPQGGMAVYVYPAKSDILEFRKTGKAAYWNTQCAKEIGKPGWVGVSEYAVSPSELSIPAAANNHTRSPAGVN